MASGTATATPIEALKGKITNEKEMPEPKRGRSSMDLTPLIEALSDLQPHAITSIESKEEKDRYARWLRQAAGRAGLEVSSTYREDKQALYFRGYKAGEAPPRGRRTAKKEVSASVKDNGKGNTNK